MNPRSLSTMLALTLLVSLISYGQTDTGTAPIPQQIVSAKKLFVSNAGVDGLSWPVFKRLGDVNQPYNKFYTALKAWGHYELVASPADADLVLEIRFKAPISNVGNTTLNTPHLELTILDARTHFILWSIIEVIEGAWRKTTWDKNFDHGMTNLLNDLKQIAAPGS